MTVWPTGKRDVNRATQHKKHKTPTSLPHLSFCYCLFNYACYKNEGYLTKQPLRGLLSLWCSHFHRPLSLLSLWCSARLLNPERMTFCTNQSTIVPPLTSFYRLLWQELGIKSVQHHALWFMESGCLPYGFYTNNTYIHRTIHKLCDKLPSRGPGNRCYCPLEKRT